MKTKVSVFAGSAMFVAVLGSAGCTIKGGAGALQPRAAFDLKCPADQIQLAEISGCGGIKMGNTRCVMGAVGCGRQATYMDVDGNWVMNSAASEVK